MTDFLRTLWNWRPEWLSLVSNDLRAVFLGAAVVFFTRAFPSPYLDNVNLRMLALSAFLCLLGLLLRLYYRRENIE